MQLTDQDERNPLVSIEAEKAVLGSFMLAAPRVNGLCDEYHLHADAFTNQQHREIFLTLRKMAMEDKPCDLVTVVETIGDHGPKTAMLEQFILDTPTDAHAEHYIGILLEKQGNRRMVQSLTTYRNEIMAGTHSSEMMRGMIEAEFAKMAQEIATELSRIEALTQQEKLYERALTCGCAGIRSGFRFWDEAFGGLQDKVLYVVSGPPGCFKTTLARNIAEHVCGVQGFRVDVATLEQSAGQLLASMAARIGHVSISRLQAGRDDLVDKWRYGRDIVSKWPVFVCDRPQTVSSLWSWGRRAKAKGSRLLVVDYMQFVKPDDSRMSDEQRVSSASGAVREMALRLDIPIICISNESNTGALRYSGQIEYDAWCWLRMRKNELADGSIAGAVFQVKKNRFGPQGGERTLGYECGAMTTIRYRWKGRTLYRIEICGRVKIVEVWGIQHRDQERI